MLNAGQMGKLAAQNEHILQKLGWQMVNLPLETANAFANWYLSYGSQFPASVEGMKELLDRCKGRIKCVSEIKKGSGPILCVGSGSSLNEIMQTVSKFRGAVMCSTSQASTLIHYGRTPDYVLCLDPRVAPQDELAAPDWGDAVLIGHVSIPHNYIAQWLRRAHGDIYLGRIMEPSYDWYSHHLGRGYPWIRHVFMPMIDSVAGEIAFATWMGYSPIYLAGVDYDGPRFDRWEWDYETKAWKLDAATSKYDAKDVTGKYAYNLTPARAMMYSSRGTLISAFLQMVNEKYRQKIYQLSDISAIRQFPKADWNGGDVKFPEGYDTQNILDEIEMALAIWDTFMVPVQNGWGLDYHTYIADQEESFYGALAKYNSEVLENLGEFKAIEEQHKRPLEEMMEKGLITIEAGELLLHGTEEFKGWDWKSIKPIDIVPVLERRRWLIREADKRNYRRGFIPHLKEMQEGDFLTPLVEKSIDQNKGNIPEEISGEAIKSVDEANQKVKEAESQGISLEPGLEVKKL
jgi:hypothetical protein